jgi:hypothetical protein
MAKPALPCNKRFGSRPAAVIAEIHPNHAKQKLMHPIYTVWVRLNARSLPKTSQAACAARQDARCDWNPRVQRLAAEKPRDLELASTYSLFALSTVPESCEARSSSRDESRGFRGLGTLTPFDSPYPMIGRRKKQWKEVL